VTAPAQYEIETCDAHDGTTRPTEQLWTPCANGEPSPGFIVHHGLSVSGISDPTDGLYPVGFQVLGHQRWADVIEAAAAYLARVYGWRNLHSYPGDDQPDLIPRLPRAVLTHAAFLRHPHPGHDCGCEWNDTWRMVWAHSTDPGAVPITAMRHPAAPAAAAGVPNPDQGEPAIWAA
jgi:hypothetical protein